MRALTPTELGKLSTPIELSSRVMDIEVRYRGRFQSADRSDLRLAILNPERSRDVIQARLEALNEHLAG